MLVPGAEEGASWVWKGPSTVPSVLEGGLGWSIESTRRERPTMSERRMNSWGLVCQYRVFASNVRHESSHGMETHLSHICTYLANLGEKLYAGHPLIKAQSCLAGKVVKMRYQPFHDVFQSRVGALRVDTMHVFCNVFNGEILEYRHRRGVCTLGGCHCAGGEVVGWITVRVYKVRCSHDKQNRG